MKIRILVMYKFQRVRVQGTGGESVVKGVVRAFTLGGVQRM